MRIKKRKRATNKVVIVTSDSVKADTKQYRISPFLKFFVIGIVLIALGVGIGYVVFNDLIWAKAVSKNQSQSETIDHLLEKNEELKKAAEETESKLLAQIDDLTNQNKTLSSTVNKLTAREAELVAELEKQSTPSRFPLTGGVLGNTEGVTSEDGEITSVFIASEGDNVIATANGTVVSIETDEQFGNKVVIDTGNGYTMVFMNRGNVLVKIGDTVVPSTKIFLITKNNKEVGYQIIKDGEYLNPTDLLELNG